MEPAEPPLNSPNSGIPVCDVWCGVRTGDSRRSWLSLLTPNHTYFA